jgi:hypothetical protein
MQGHIQVSDNLSTERRRLVRSVNGENLTPKVTGHLIVNSVMQQDQQLQFCILE